MTNIKKYIRGLLILVVLLPVLNMECLGSITSDLGGGTMNFFQSENSEYSNVMNTENTLISGLDENFSTYSTPSRKRGYSEYSTPTLYTPNKIRESRSPFTTPESQRMNDYHCFTPECTPGNERFKVSQSPFIPESQRTYDGLYSIPGVHIIGDFEGQSTDGDRYYILESQGTYDVGGQDIDDLESQYVGDDFILPSYS